MPLVLSRSPQAVPSSSDDVIDIGVLNNLSDAGLERGDRQIVDALTAAAGTTTVRLHFFSLPSIPRNGAARAYIEASYSDYATLRETRLDGLFVTGCEPREDALPDEPFWPELTSVMDWAEHNTGSTIWSCLAAHAAVLHFDGIGRRKMAEKRSGLFMVERTGDHPFLAGAPANLCVPHSRHNDLDRQSLVAAGYRILTEGPIVGVDTFTKTWRSLFVYLQGHPEYDAEALRREYRRDVLRYLDGTNEAYPRLPDQYFDGATEARLLAFAAEARRVRDPAKIAELPLPPERASQPGASRHLAPHLFRDWLHYLRAKAAKRAV